MKPIQDSTTRLTRSMDSHTSQMGELTKVLDRYSDEQITAINRVAEALREVAEAIRTLER